MGMDVYGRNPSSPDGELFRGQSDVWHVLADAICALAPSEARACKNWHSNDGNGLTADESLALAERLQHCIADGSVERYVNASGAKSQNRLLLYCHRCKLSVSVIGSFQGVGIVRKSDLLQSPFEVCKSCGNRSVTTMSESTVGELSVEGVREFALFSRHSGGFSIW